MTLYLVGMGLGGAQDLTVRGKKILSTAHLIFLDQYTSTITGVLDGLKMIGVIPEIVQRGVLEDQALSVIIEPAKDKNVVVLTVGHPLVATTHITLLLLAKENHVPFEVVQNASVMDAVALTGLQVYKFGKIGSIPFAAVDDPLKTETPARILVDNQSIGAHTLFLLDLRPSENKYLSVAQALRYLAEQPLTQKCINESKHIIACARLGHTTQKIISGKASWVARQKLGDAPYCIIIPGTMHFLEEEALQELSDETDQSSLRN